MAGRLIVPYTFPGEVPLLLDLQRLHFKERAPGVAKPSRPDPRNLPAITANLGEFIFDGRNFGHVEAEFARGTAGLTAEPVHA